MIANQTLCKHPFFMSKNSTGSYHLVLPGYNHNLMLLRFHLVTECKRYLSVQLFKNRLIFFSASGKLKNPLVQRFFSLCFSNINLKYQEWYSARTIIILSIYIYIYVECIIFFTACHNDLYYYDDCYYYYYSIIFICGSHWVSYSNLLGTESFAVAALLLLA